MKVAKEPPAGYRQLADFDLGENPRLALALNLLGLPLLALWGWVFLQAGRYLRPEFLAGDGYRFTLAEGLKFLAAMVLMVALHEGVHGLFFWLFTRQRPAFALHIYYAYAAAPEWYLPRNQYLAVGLAPLALISLGGLALMPFVPVSLLPSLIFLLALNASGAIGDVLIVAWMLTFPPQIVVNDRGDRFTIHGPG